MLLQAVARARGQGADIRCALVGDGVSRPGLVALAAELGLGRSVCVIPGRVDRSSAMNWYQALDVFCVPRLDTPVCRLVTPIKPMTAMALGRPVVVSSLPALRELTALGASRSFPPGDAEALARVLIRMAAESGGRSGPTSAGDPSQPPGPLSCPPQQGLPTWDANAARQIEIYKELV